MRYHSRNTNYIRREYHNAKYMASDFDVFNNVVMTLGPTLESDKAKHIQYFDCFAFVWSLLPPWASSWLLSLAYREWKAVFEGVTPTTPLYDLTPRQRELLEQRCDEALSVFVCLFSNLKFTEGHYQVWKEIQLAKQQEADPHVKKSR